MPKNIALFIDGTWNEPIEAETNVYKLFAAAADDAGQEKKYLSGVGTVRLPQGTQDSGQSLFSRARAVIAATRQLEKKLLAGAGGWGIGDLIKEAYQFLSSRYDDGDHIYLFGFSRGAFAARSLTGFAEAVGLLLREDDQIEHVTEAYALYENGTDARQSPLRDFLRRITGSSAPGPEGPQVLPIYLIGLWDTVAALGLPGRLKFFTAPFTEFHQTELPSNVTHARHALALHEIREIFEPTLWLRRSSRNPYQTLEQVWFTGAHADVGGGYDENETAWSNVALDWMAAEATKFDFRLNCPLPPLQAPNEESIHHEWRGVFKRSTPTMRKALAARKKLEPETTETYRMHETVVRRFLTPQARQYAFGSDINKKLEEIDETSLQLSLEILSQAESPQPAAPWWTTVRVAEVAQAAHFVSDFIQGIGDPTESTEQFTRAFFLKILCEDKDAFTKVVGRLKQTNESKLRLLPANPLDPEYQKWALRLGIAAKGIEKSALLLPARYHSEARQASDTLNDEFQRFCGQLHMLTFRVKFPPREW